MMVGDNIIEQKMKERGVQLRIFNVEVYYEMQCNYWFWNFLFYGDSGMQFRLVFFRKIDNLVCCYQVKLMELIDKVWDEDMVDVGVCVVDEGNIFIWRLDDLQVL